jgi:thiol-disulfide isomerase/thioredoxin
MARTLSTMLELQSELPDVSLSNGLDETFNRLSHFKTDKGLVVMFICNHCPFVIHIKDELKKFGTWAISLGIGVVAINSNDVSQYPDDHPQKMKEEGYPFPYLYDESQEVAKLFKAACTPDFYVFNDESKLVYRGQFDDSRPGNDHQITGSDLRLAVTNMLKNEQVIIEPQKPSLGCNIKWKKGAEPTYFFK